MEKSDKRILIFERDRDFASVIERILKDEGYEVETTRSLHDVQQKTTQHNHDVLIVSKSSASESEAESLRRIDSSPRKILVANRPDVSDIAIFVDAGFDDYVALTRDSFRSDEAKNLILAVRGLAGGKERRSRSQRRREKILVFDEDSKKDLEKTFTEAGFMDVFKTGDLTRAVQIGEDKTP